MDCRGEGRGRESKGDEVSGGVMESSPEESSLPRGPDPAAAG